MKRYFAAALLIGLALFAPSAVSFADDASSGDVSKRLSNIEQDQVKILQSLEEVKNELRIVKARVTSR